MKIEGENEVFQTFHHVPRDPQVILHHICRDKLSLDSPFKSILFDRALEFAEHFLRTEKRHHLFPGSLICNLRLPGRQWLNLLVGPAPHYLVGEDTTQGHHQLEVKGMLYSKSDISKESGLNVSMPGQSPMLAACSFLPHSAPTLSIR